MPDQPFSPEDLPQPGFSIMSLSGGISPFELAVNNSGGVYIVWEKRGDEAPAYYQVLRSTSFEGNYQTIGTLPAPADSFVDTNGQPQFYYKIREIAQDMTVAFTSGPISAEELLVNQSLYYQIKDLMNHRINNETALFGKDRKSALFAYKNWNTLPRPEIRINCSNSNGNRDPWLVLDDATTIKRTFGSVDDYPTGLKIKMDWHGRVHFLDEEDRPVSIKEYNEIEASYHMRIFKHAEIRQAMLLALQMLNAQPGTNKYMSIAGIPLEYEAGIVVGATFFLYRQLHASCLNPEFRLRLLDPDLNAFASMDHLRETIKMYEEDWKALLKSIPRARLPQLRTIVTPEYAMPGGRSRMFRYLWKGGGSA